MMRAVLLAATILLWASGQEPKENGQHDLPKGPPPDVKPIEWTLGGGVVMKVTFERKRLDDGFESVYWCTRRCKGQRHLQHKDCDFSCDERCTENHAVTLRALRPIFEIDRDALIAFDAGQKKAGVSDEYLLIHLDDEIKSQLDDLKKYDLRPRWTHWNDSPCSEQTRHPYYAEYEVTAHVTFTPKTGEPVKFDMVTHEYVPTEKYKDDPPIVSCRCDVVKETPPPPAEEPKPEKINDEHGSIIIEEQGTQHCCTTKEEIQFSLTCEVQDMGHCTWSGENPTDHDVDCTICPGVTLICTSDSEQDMCTTSMVRLHLPAHPRRGPSIDRVSAKGRVACINLLKGMPDGSFRYRIGPSAPPAVRGLAYLEDREGFKNAESQMRIWIVTDHADRATLEKHMLFPKPTQERYLRALQIVDRMPNFTMEDPAYLPCLDPVLLGAVGVPAQTTRWLALALERNKPDGVRPAISPPTFAGLWGDPKGDAHAADVANALCASSDSRLFESGIRFLKEIVPPEHRAAVMMKGGLSAASMALTQTDSKAARQALDALKLYGASDELGLRNVNPALPSDVRKEAAALLKKLE